MDRTSGLSSLGVNPRRVARAQMELDLAGGMLRPGEFEQIAAMLCGPRSAEGVPAHHGSVEVTKLGMLLDIVLHPPGVAHFDEIRCARERGGGEQAVIDMGADAPTRCFNHLI